MLRAGFIWRFGLIVVGVLVLGELFRPGPHLFGLHVNGIVIDQGGAIAYQNGHKADLIRAVRVRSPAALRRLTPSRIGFDHREHLLPDYPRVRFVTDLGEFTALTCYDKLHFGGRLDLHTNCPPAMEALLSTLEFDSLQSKVAVLNCLK